VDVALQTLLSAAVRAPSGDNTQPWRFEVAPDRIVLLLDETRDPSPMNSGQRMARIALGAALENVLRIAQASGWDAKLEDGSPPALAVVRLQRPAEASAHVEQAVTVRVTNRRPYDGRPLPADTLARLTQATPLLHGVSSLWIADRSRLPALAVLVGRADATMFGETSMRRAFLSKVRFDADPRAEVEEGMPLASLEASALERFALRTLARLPRWLLKGMGAFRSFAAKARKLVESASGLCLVTAPDGAERTDLNVGRAMQRAWLALTQEGLAVQPMMSLLVLMNVVEHGSAELTARLGRDRLAELDRAFRALVPEVGGARPAFLMRFGFAPAPSGRTGRLPLQAVVSAKR
jgi:nitroreductase